MWYRALLSGRLSDEEGRRNRAAHTAVRINGGARPGHDDCKNSRWQARSLWYLANVEHRGLGHSGPCGGARGARRSRGRRRQRPSVSTVGAGEEEAELREPEDGRPGDEVLRTRRPARHLHAVSVSERPDADIRGNP